MILRLSLANKWFEGVGRQERNFKNHKNDKIEAEDNVDSSSVDGKEYFDRSIIVWNNDMSKSLFRLRRFSQMDGMALL